MSYETIVKTPEELDIWDIGRRVFIELSTIVKNIQHVVDGEDIIDEKKVILSSYYGYLYTFSIINDTFTAYLRGRSEGLKFNPKNGTCTITYNEEIFEND